MNSQAGDPGHDPFYVGRALEEDGLLAPAQFASARRLWRRKPQEGFVLLLSRLGLGESRQIASIVARRHGLEFAELDPAGVDPESVRLLAQDRARAVGAIAFRRSGRILHIATSDPAAYGRAQASEDFPGEDIELHVAARPDILEALEQAWRPPPSEPAAAERFQSLLRQAVAARASDLHLEPREHSLEVRLRVDGRLVHHSIIEEEAREPIVQAAKLAGRMDIAERRLPQDGRGSLHIGARSYHLRYSSLPAAYGEAIVVRIIDERAPLRSFREMGLESDDEARLRELVSLPSGLVYVTGPTGSGKTTLLYSMLANLPAGEIDSLKIVTLEDPVEVRDPRRYLQVSIDERIGRSFSELLRHVLRHDPDVILVGETRDAPTADITLKAALTGHLCLSTLHTSDAVGAVARLLDLGLDPLMLSSALKGVVAQRLVRRPCPECSRPHPRARELFERHAASCEGIHSAEIRFTQAAHDPTCPHCRGTGYLGRIAIAEVFPLAGLEELIARRAPGPEVRAKLRNRGFRSLAQDGIRKAARGLTTPEEVFGAVEV